jgi:hypothetical protein
MQPPGSLLIFASITILESEFLSGISITSSQLLNSEAAKTDIMNLEIIFFI